MNKTLLTGVLATALLAACNQQDAPTATASDSAIKSTETAGQAVQRAREQAQTNQTPPVSATTETAGELASDKAEQAAQAADEAVQKADAQIKEADEQVRKALKKAE